MVFRKSTYKYSKNHDQYVPQAEEIIRDLLHPTKEKRIAAIEELREEWNIEYRPYLWRAIELEKEKSVQRMLVDLAINKLEDKSLRKMIRFIENGELTQASLKLVLSAYPEFETAEVREALIKAIQRQKKNIQSFVIQLLQHPNLTALGGSKLSFLLEELFGPETPVEMKFEFASAYLHRYNLKRLPVGYELQSFIRDYKDDPVVRKAIIRYIIEKPRQNVKKPVSYIWQEFDYSKSSLNKLGEYENYLFDSFLYRDNELRNEAIKALGKSTLPKIPEIYPTLAEPLFEIWELLISFNLERKFVALDGFDESSLEDFFSGDAETIYQLIRVSEIPIQTIVNFILGYLPRSILLTMTRDDPDQENRKLCYTELKREAFWKMDDGYLGPLLIWKRIFDRIITASQFESSRDVKETAYELFEFLIVLVMEMDDEHQKSIVDLLEKQNLVEKLTAEQDVTIIASIKLMLNLLLKQEDIEFEGERIHHDAAINITKRILYNLNNPQYFSIISGFLSVQGPTTRKQIIEEIDIFIHDNINQLSNFAIQIQTILDTATRDDEVSIRTRAKLMQKKLKL